MGLSLDSLIFNENMKKYLSLVKFEHTLFGMPFAMIGYFLGVKGFDFEVLLLIKIILAMVFARNAAMGMNRLVDRHFDALNPRTATREIPAGVISPKAATLFVLINSILFIVTALWINSLCFYLSFVALAILLGYSFTKRFTSLCHLFLGLALSISPTAAYIAVTGSIDIVVILISLMVLFWVSGFDILYSLSDEEFDRQNSLYSIPSVLGRNRAFNVSIILHIMVLPLLLLVYQFGNFGFMYIVGASVFSALLIYQHLIVKPSDLSRLNAAFFTSNGIASLAFSVFVILDILL